MDRWSRKTPKDFLSYKLNIEGDFIMSGVNKAIIVGRLGRDPELKNLPNGTPVCNFSVATSENWVDKSGKKQEKTEWHRIVVFGKVGENCSKYLSKGSEVYLEGKIQTREWEKDGHKNYTTEINAVSVQFLSSSKKSEQSSISTDEIPF